MAPRTRLILCSLIVALSALYAVVVATDPEVAQAIALGYISVVLTIYLLATFWRRP